MGYPCTSVSRQNNKPQSFQDPTSATGGGFKALLDYLDGGMPPRILITENVGALGHNRVQFGEKPIEIQACFIC